jgi:plasmid stability protein
MKGPKMIAAQWIGAEYYIGRIKVGQISLNWTPGPKGETIAGLCSLPGAAQILGPYANEATAKEMVEKSANSRVQAMFGAGINTTRAAVNEGRELRISARAILRAGIWTCEKPVNAYALFTDLRHALGMKHEDAPEYPKPRPNLDEGEPQDTDQFSPFDHDDTYAASA